MNEEDKNISRRDFLATSLRFALGIGIGGISGFLINQTSSGDMLWQIDARKCVQCGRCVNECVLTLSAVKCVHVFDMCGYCDLCGGYFRPETNELTTAAENQLCPTNAIERKFIEEPFFEYTIVEDLCIGCGKCVAGCGAFGNGSLQLQVRHDICVNCNQCSISRHCPADAFVRVPADSPNIFKKYSDIEIPDENKI